MGRPREHWSPPGWAGAALGGGIRVFRHELVEHPEWHPDHPGGQDAPGLCRGHIHTIYIRRGEPARLVKIGIMCQGCFVFWPADHDYRQMPITPATTE